MAQDRNRGQIQPRGDGRWLVRVFVGSDIDENGKRKRKYISETIKGTFKEAERHLTKKLSEADTNTIVEPSKLTMKVYIQQWLETQTQLAYTSRRGYTDAVRSLYPALGSVRLDKLTPLQVQHAVTGLTKQGLGGRSVEYSYMVLKAACSAAVELGLLARTPCRGVNLPGRDKKAVEVWTAEETQQFLSRSRFTADHVLWLTELTSGLRPEEYLALGWQEVDLDAGLIRVTRALNKSEGGGYVVGEPKTKASWRSITIPKETVEALRAHKRKQAAEALSKGEDFQRLGFVFAGGQGNHQEISAVRRRFKTALKHAGVKAIPLYSMRHTHATLLLTAGVHPKVVQERLGHSSIKMTMDTYSHVLMTLQTQTAETLSGILFTPQDQAIAK